MELASKTTTPMKIPDPIVIKNSHPVKALKVLKNYIIIGQDDGWIKIYDKSNLQFLAQQIFLSDQVLRIEQIMGALIIQFKDKKGSLYLVQQPNPKFDYNMNVELIIETLNTGFTNLASSVISHPDSTERILLAYPQYNQMHQPKVTYLNQTASAIEKDLILECRANQTVETKPKKKEFAPKKKETKDNKGQKKDKKEEKKQDSKKNKSELPPNGNLSCLKFTNLNGYSELLTGFDSGAIGIFRLYLDEQSNIQFTQVVSIQKLIQDPKIHHVLSMNVINFKPGEGDFKLCIGYYASLLQTIDFTLASDSESYLIQTQNFTEQNYTEKPGIGCLSSLIIKKKALLASGGFDHRIRLVSAKTMKPLVNLPFHEGIINQVEMEQGKNESEVILYACSEDGYLSVWNLIV